MDILMKMHTFFGICGLMLLFSNIQLHGQALMIYSPILVSEARNLPKDSWAVLAGNVVNTLPGGKQYTFRDSSGEIIVEIDRKVWRGLSVGINDRVEIQGEVDIHRGQVLIKAKAIIGSFAPTVRQGQPVTIRQSITVTEARNLPKDSWAVLTGNIVNLLPGNKYTFRDSSGEIIVKIERKVWRGLFVDMGDTVEIRGEVEVDKREVSIDVKAIRKI